jgi:hypothetical protein
MRTDCTELFYRYRELARLLWNLGLWIEPTLRQWDALQLYREISARLFEALVLLPLGYQGRIERNDTPGSIANFQVVLRGPEAPLLVDKNLPHEPPFGEVPRSRWGPSPVSVLGSSNSSTGTNWPGEIFDSWRF